MLRVQVEWLDSGAIRADSWETKDAIVRQVKLGNVLTVGWLMEETDDAYYVALSYDPDHEHYFGVQAISKPSVKSFVQLRARKERE